MDAEAFPTFLDILVENPKEWTIEFPKLFFVDGIPQEKLDAVEFCHKNGIIFIAYYLTYTYHLGL